MKKKPTGITPAALLKNAKEMEENGEWEEAASLYEKVIKADPHREAAYNRLMIILRKQKKYKNELALINKGIKTFKDFYDPGSRKSINKKVEKLSKALLKSTGLADKKEPRFTSKNLLVAGPGENKL